MSSPFDRSEPCGLFLLPPSSEQAPSKTAIYRLKSVDDGIRYFMLSLLPNSRRFYRIATESGVTLEMWDIEDDWKARAH